MFGRSITSFSAASNGKVVIGNAITSSDVFVTSNAVTPESFHDKSAPLAGNAGLLDAVNKKILRKATIQNQQEWTNAFKQEYAKSNHPLQSDDNMLYGSLINAYVVLKEFTCPPGLFGAFAANFYIPPGVPAPKGDCGHSAIYDFNAINPNCRNGVGLVCK